MNKFFCLLILFAFFSLTDCKENDPADLLVLDNEYLSEVPVFTFNETNIALLIEAGVDDFYMFSDYEVDAENRITFTSSFSKLNTCSTQCEYELKIIIKDSQVFDDLENLNISELIQVESYGFGSSGVSPLPSQISVEYTDRNGITFQSNLAEQTAESIFNITKISEYGPNENGDPTKKINIEMTCVLKDVLSEATVEFVDAQAIISIAYPK